MVRGLMKVGFKNTVLCRAQVCMSGLVIFTAYYVNQYLLLGLYVFFERKFHPSIINGLIG